MTMPLVSVKMLTYNQVNYVAQAIESVLRQITNFPFDLVIGEDCSTDGSREIVFEYKRRHPSFISIVTSSENVGPQKNSDRTYRACRGEYIAFCEGDDYWTDPYKLQKEVDFLEKNQNYDLVHTNFDMLYDASGEIHKAYHSNKAVLQGNIYEQLLHDNFIWTVTIMARRKILMDCLQEIDLVNKKWLMGDYPIFLAMSLCSKIGYIEDVTSTYRVLANSAVHSPDPIKKVMLTKSYNDIKLYFIEKYGCTEGTRIKINVAYYKFLLRSSFTIGDYELAKLGRELFLRTKMNLSWRNQWKERCVIPLCTSRHLFLAGRMMYTLLRLLQSKLNK
jgi:glycosyltransferase involved in cell wall biosynthesis